MAAPSSHRRELPEGHFSGANARSAAGRDWSRWASSPRRSASCPARRRRWSRRWPSRGWCKYEPYAGVRLTAAGEKLAALVLRRHRLIELFLVKVMGMSWTEVHDEAEHLEHAVSDRLIERIDEMLGRPGGRSARRSDSDPEGTVEPPRLRHAAHLSAQRAGHGQPRDRSGHGVPAVRRAPRPEAGQRRRGRGARRRGRQRAAARRRRPRDHDRRARRVEGARAGARGSCCCCSAAARRSRARADAAPPAAPIGEPFEITRQLVPRRGSVQPGGGHLPEHLRRRTRIDGDWAVGVHAGVAGRLADAPVLVHPRRSRRRRRHSAFGDVLLNYRYQALMEGPGRPAFSPRVSLILPTGDATTARATGRRPAVQPAVQQAARRLLLPLERRASPGCRRPRRRTSTATSDANLLVAVPRRQRDLPAAADVQPDAGERAALRAVPVSTTAARSRDHAFTLSPGVRGGWNLGDQQLDPRCRGPDHVGRRRTRTPACSSTSPTSCRSRSTGTSRVRLRRLRPL